jgi:uncharacterized protein YggE
MYRIVTHTVPHLSQHLQQVALLQLLPQGRVYGQADVALLQLQVQVLALLHA